jgi:hypothetical protein
MFMFNVDAMNDQAQLELIEDRGSYGILFHRPSSTTVKSRNNQIEVKIKANIQSSRGELHSNTTKPPSSIAVKSLLRGRTTVKLSPMVTPEPTRTAILQLSHFD